MSTRKADDITPSPQRPAKPPSVLNDINEQGAAASDNGDGEEATKPSRSQGQPKQQKMKSPSGSTQKSLTSFFELFSGTSAQKRSNTDRATTSASRTTAKGMSDKVEVEDVSSDESISTETSDEVDNNKEEVDFSMLSGVKLQSVNKQKTQRSSTKKNKKGGVGFDLRDEGEELAGKSQGKGTKKKGNAPTGKGSQKKAKKRAAASNKVEEDDDEETMKWKDYAHQHRIIVQIGVRVGKVSKPIEHFDRYLMGALEFLQEHVDESTSILPKYSSLTCGPLRKSGDMPHVGLVINKNWFEQSNDFAFTDTENTENGRTIKCSCILGMDVDDPERELNRARGDLQALFKVSIFFKACQHLDTTQRLVFLGAPRNWNPEDAKERMESVMRPLEIKLMEEDPEEWPAFMHKQSWPDFSVVSAQPEGMPWEATKPGQRRKGPPRERKCLQIMCATNDYERLAKLVYAAKLRGEWIRTFGFCYPTEVPDNSDDYTDDDKDNYVDMVLTHQSAQLSYGSATLVGLKKLDFYMELRRVDAAGNEVEPETLCMQDVLQSFRYMGKRLWICIAKTRNGRFVGYFPGSSMPTKTYIQTWLRATAAQIYWHLIKRGFNVEDVTKFVKKHFDVEQQQLCTKAKYNPTTKLAYVEGGDFDSDIAAAARRKGCFVDTLLGLTDLQKERKKSRDGIVFGDAKEGSMEAYNFKDGQSIKTVKNKSKIKGLQESGPRSLGESIFAPVGPDEDISCSDAEEEDADEDYTEEESEADEDKDDVGSHMSDDNEDSDGGKDANMEQDEAQDNDEIFQDAQDTEEGTAKQKDNSVSLEEEDVMEEDERDHRMGAPETFLDHLWNEAGPGLGAMLIACKALTEEEEYHEFMGRMGPEFAHGPIQSPSWMTAELVHRLDLEAEAAGKSNSEFLDEIMDVMAGRMMANGDGNEVNTILWRMEAHQDGREAVTEENNNEGRTSGVNNPDEKVDDGQP